MWEYICSRSDDIFKGGSKISRRGRGPVWGGHGLPTRALFGENVCENERIESHRGRAPENFVCRSANGYKGAAHNLLATLV